MIREAASVIVLRRTAGGLEVLLVRRNRGASFMASACVFPGGAAEPGEDAPTAALRELFEEAGVLIAREAASHGAPPAPRALGELRRAVQDGAAAGDVLARAGLAFAPDTLVPWAHWITPSVETKRFSARMFVVELPDGQQASLDEREAVEAIWIAPGEALGRAAELRLPPPQVRTCWELAQLPDLASVMAAGRARAAELHPIMPRLSQDTQPPCLLLPWDPEYLSRGTGEATPLTFQPAWARGPSRFVMEDRAWKHVGAPGSTTAAW